MLKLWTRLLPRRLPCSAVSPILLASVPRIEVHPGIVMHSRLAFSTKPPSDPTKKRSRGRPSKKSKEASSSTEESSTPQETAKVTPKPAYSFEQPAEEREAAPPPVERIYVMKFNAPITPFSKFPLTQNNYILEFFKRYEEDKENVGKVLAVHFDENSNSNAEGACGIEVELVKKNNLNYVESKNFRRYTVLSFDETSNFCDAQEVVDQLGELSSEQQQNLVLSEMHDLKRAWYAFNKKMNSLLGVLPQEGINAYDMLLKSLPLPSFEIHKYMERNLFQIFREVTFKMAHYYFSLQQTLFSNSSDIQKELVNDFLKCNDPFMRS